MSNLVLVDSFSFGDVSIQGLHYKNEPVFAAFEVAKILGYENPHEAVSDHCEETFLLKYKEVGTSETLEMNKISGLTLEKGITLIYEADVYALILRSKLESAKKFQRWICKEVLPSIRKHGKYEAPQKTIEATADKVLLEVEMLKQENKELREAAQQKPKRKPSYSRVEPMEVEQEDGSVETVWFHKGGSNIPCELYKNYASIIRAIANVESLVGSIKKEVELSEIPKQVLGSGLKITRLQHILSVFW